MSNFDQFADSYQQVHTDNIRVTGETSEYFAQYKAQYIARRIGAHFSGRILDYGCGVGMLSGYMKELFPTAIVDGYDVSQASLDKINSGLRERGRFTSDVTCVGRGYNVIVVSNVMHHVRPDKRQDTISFLQDRLAHGGILIIVEHNPLNPLTRWAVANCAFDDDAILLPAKETTGYFLKSGLDVVRRDYIVFFPHFLASFRPMEPYLGWCCVGAQYAMIARRPQIRVENGDTR